MSASYTTYTLLLDNLCADILGVSLQVGQDLTIVSQCALRITISIAIVTQRVTLRVVVSGDQQLEDRL